ncbi:TetR/AcrR family transcriptional regulator [Frankia sp. CNm7]|uniref:TetR/AcrR family transcriptional regulator n=1 Tax=Frankia nepalensis TaxID=1836974 RepID=A0A937RQD7_9ACTN|nr:TetR/AcrR family transcriptional regulator [Frankia nepalensis]MBL7498980.1 TetR/AcrR family transcriptional regulator [Frankia nepalensis]MBL7511500.1 TetR/AcrR family transcriptional regulator [Frankia nepalensis]MBL7520716.1 TetR/AcrR family transcriptional regulator [Frankia nepalensis]MBL7630743.1 TetR/AcrR family transcriptional regulator [Frankia nepalensis]
MRDSTKGGSGRPPGRPRAYDPEVALERATETFWRAGLSGTTLDDLAHATAMNRPSLYAAFGDKKAMYLKALERYGERGQVAIEQRLAAERLPDALLGAYRAAIAIYAGSDGEAPGCFLVSTATVEARTDPRVRALLAEGIRRVDEMFAARIHRAVDDGELDDAVDAVVLAQLATAVLHTLALRARAGVPPATLEALASAGVRHLLGL